MIAGRQLTCAVVVLFAEAVTGVLLGAGVGKEGVGLVIMKWSGKMTEMGLQVGDRVRFRES